MASIQSAIAEHLAQAFTLCIPYALQTQMDLLPADTRHTLLGELLRLAARAGLDERPVRPQPVPLALALAGCDMRLELDGIQRRLTLVSLLRGRPGAQAPGVFHSPHLSPGPAVSSRE